jgi:hypothetical protein
MKSGNLNFLEPSGPLQACKGTFSPLRLPENISGAFMMWYWCHNYFRILCIHQVAIIDCRKLKIEVGVAYTCILYVLNFVQISHLFQEFGKGTQAWRV